MLHKLRIALAMTLLALAAVSAVDSALALPYRVTTDDAGEVASYERLHRYNRGSTSGVIGP
jgi:hypothetical protein